MLTKQFGAYAHYEELMPYRSWRDAVEAIRKTVGPATVKQRKLAKIAGIAIPENLPKLVAGARLQNALGPDLGVRPTDRCTYGQEQLLSELNDGSEPILADLFGEAEDSFSSPSPCDRREANAWIGHLILKARLRALEQLQPEAGDLVILTGSDDAEVEEVASISSNGRIHFKGGLGAGAWPDRITVRFRKGDITATARNLRHCAANRAAHRMRFFHFTTRKHLELATFETKAHLSSFDIELLQGTLEAAKDESPIQQLIESHPQILTALLSGEPRFLLPRKSLAGFYVPDFLLCDSDSAGTRWLLVELETPLSSITLKSQNGLELHARTGVNQVIEWREWLQNNLDIARRSKKEQGLGLAGIRPRSRGIVFVGRRLLLNDNAERLIPLSQGARYDV